MSDEVLEWRPYATLHPEHSVVGELLVSSPWHSPQLKNEREVLVYLPPSYREGPARYPVLYMHDAQNLFDRHVGFGGQEWEVDETLTRLSEEDEDLEVMVVALAHMDKHRIREYNPFPHSWHGRGDKYLKFLVETVKPQIDREFRTRPEPAYTGILGSSMGGLISLYAFFAYPQVFGLAGAMSPSLWLAHGAIYPYVQKAAVNPGKIYIDNGTHEMSARRMYRLLQEKGYKPDLTLKYVREEGGEHTESAWARRLPEALRFLLS